MSADTNAMCSEELDPEVDEVEQLFQEKRYSEAIDRCTILLDGRKPLGTNHPAWRRCADELQSLYFVTGRYEQALPVAKDLLSGTSPQETLHFDQVSKIGGLYDRMGDFEAAERFYVMARDLRVKHLGEQHQDSWHSMSYLASLYRKMGAFDKALGCMEKISQLRGWNKKVPETSAEREDHIFWLEGVALINRAQGHFAEAEAGLKEVVEFRRSLQDESEEEGRFYATSVSNLAGVLSQMHQPVQAYARFEEALALRRKVHGNKHISIAQTLRDFAEHHERNERFDEALQLYVEASAILVQAHGEDHPHVASTMVAQARCHCFKSSHIAECDGTDIAMEGFEKALELFIKASDIRSKSLVKVLSSVSEPRRLAFLSMVEQDLHLLLSLAFGPLAGSHAASKAALNSVLRLKAVSLDVQVTEDASDELKALRQMAARLLFDGSTAEKRKACDERIEQLEAASRKTVDISSPMYTSSVESVVAVLPEATSLLECIVFRFSDFKRAPLDKPEMFYAVWTVEDTGLVDSWLLGSAADLNAIIKNIRTQASKQQCSKSSLVSLEQSCCQLRERLLDPALRRTVRHLFIAADGELSRVPFATLSPITGEGCLLGEALTVSLLFSGRDLLILKDRKDRCKSRSPSRPVVVAAPSFQQEIMSLSSHPAAVRSLDWRRGFEFAPLPETHAEGCAVSQLICGELLVGDEATSTAFTGIEKPGILHVATHGFFLPDLTTVDGRLEAVLSKAENPLLRCGLAFAGAQAWQNGSAGADGILTAQEIRTMDLRGTELVVLSACNTGLGDVVCGQGVMGLARAFIIAGAQAVIMSLWPIGDKATRELMVDFYTLMMSGSSPVQALQNAMQNLKSRDHRPAGWAAFVLHGFGLEPLSLLRKTSWSGSCLEL